MRALYEPVATNPYLADFYKDPKRWAFSMQVHMLHWRHHLHRLAVCELMHDDFSGVLLDRGLPGDRIFCNRQRAYGNISMREWTTYNRMYETLTSCLMPPSTLVYLDVAPEVAHARAARRSRDAEEHLTLEYLIDLKTDYDELVDHLEVGLHPWSRSVNVLRVPWNNDDESVEPLRRTLAKLHNLENWHGSVRPQGVVHQPRYFD